MAVSKSLLDRRELVSIVGDYGLGKLAAVEPRVGSFAEYGVIGVTTSKGKFVVKVDETKSELELKRELDLLTFARKHGLPCPQPLADRKGRAYREHSGRWVSLHKRSHGQHVRGDDLSVSQLENVGRVLADLHQIGRGYKKGIDNKFSFERIADLYHGIRPTLPHYFKRIIRTLDEEVEYLRYYLEGKLPKGIIHGEMFAELLRFRGDKVVCVTNFDAASRGKYVFDLATAINALCFEEGRYDLKRFESLISGYESLRTLSLAEWDAFPNELRFSALRFTITRLRDFAGSANGAFQVSRDFEDFYDRLLILRREKEGGMDGLLMAMATGYDYRKYQKVKAAEKKGR